MWYNIICQDEMLECRLVNDYHECRELLKQVYCDELKWCPPEDNIINHRIENNELCDDYDDKVIWAGVWDGSLLVGVARAFVGNRYEHEIDAFLANSCFDKGDINPILMSGSLPDIYVEVNRLAVKESHRKKGVHCMLMGLAMKIAILYGGIPIITSTNHPSIAYQFGDVNRKIGSMLYYDDDPVDIYIFEKPLEGLEFSNMLYNTKYSN